MLFRVLAVAAAATALAPLAVEAGSIYQSGGPAELPPASFRGNQFVDSSGCIFMRAGYGNQTSWVPRVTRDRRVMCGYKPTFAASQTRPVQGGGITTAVTLAKPKPMPLTDVPPPKAVQIAQAPAPQPFTTSSTKVGTPMATIAGSVGPGAAAGSGQMFTAQTTPSAPAPAPGTIYTAQTTGGSVGNVPVAPPQPLLPRAAAPGGQEAGVRYVTLGAAAPVAPAPATGQKIYTSQTTGNYGFLSTAPQTGTDMTPPPGYKAAWTDGRLNPLRGPRTEAGNQQMNLVWTQTVPRRLINTTTMRDVTAQYPGLQYPQTAHPPQPTGAVPEGYRPIRPTRVASVKQPRVTLSTSNGGAARVRGTAPRRAPVVASQAGAARVGGKYVQVGLFGVPSNATHTVARLQAAGLPVRVSTIRSRGRVLRAVMAGPFASPSQLSAALVTARRAGFGDAYIR